MVFVENVTADHPDMAADRRNRNITVIILASGLGVRLGHRVFANRLDNQVPILSGYIFFIDKTSLRRVKLEPNVVISVWLAPDFYDRPRDAFAGRPY